MQDLSKEGNFQDITLTTPNDGILDEAELDEVAGGLNNCHPHPGKGDNSNTGDGSVRVGGTKIKIGNITDGTSNTIIFGE